MTPSEAESLQTEMARALQEKHAFEQSLRDRYGSEVFGHYMTEAELHGLGALDDRVRKLGAGLMADSRRVPAAPFERNWHELLMKRMLRYAVDHGLDRLAWTTGAQQNRRNSMTRVVQSVARDPDYQSDRYYRIRYNGDSETGFYVRPDGIVYDSVIGLNGRHIDDVFGSALSARVQSLGVGEELTGVDLTLGEKSLATFYDVRLTRFMADYVRQWGAQVVPVRLPLLSQDGMDCTGGLLMHSVEVTPAMRESLSKGQPMFMRSPSGTLYGFTVGADVFLTERGLRTETLVHEYTHVLASAMQHGNPEGWQAVKDLLRSTPLWSEVTSDSLYHNIREDDDLVASEALARISGRKGAEKLQEMMQGREAGEAASILERLRLALQTFWGWVGRHMFDIKTFRSVDEVTDRVLYDLPRLDAPGQVMQCADGDKASRITDIHVFMGRGGLPHIRCRVDGVQQMGVPLQGADVHSFPEAELTELAARYFLVGLKNTDANVPQFKR